MGVTKTACNWYLSSTSPDGTHIETMIRKFGMVLSCCNYSFCFLEAPFVNFSNNCVFIILDTYREAEIYIKQVGVHHFKKWKSQYSNTVNCLYARLQLFILRSVSLCLSGFRTKWRGAGASDRVDICHRYHINVCF